MRRQNENRRVAMAKLVYPFQRVRRFFGMLIGLAVIAADFI